MGVSGGQESLAHCSPWGCKGLDTTEQQNNNARAPRVFMFSTIFPRPLSKNSSINSDISVTDNRGGFNFSLHVLNVMVWVHTCVQFFVIPWTVALQVPVSMELSQQQYCSRLPFPTPGDLPNTGIEPPSLASPELAGRFFFYHCATWEVNNLGCSFQNTNTININD